MNSRANPRFRKAYESLPEDIKEQARRVFLRFEKNPFDQNLAFKKIEGSDHLYSVRINLSYRALARRADSSLVWFWIGSHAEYDRMIAKPDRIESAS